MKRHVSSLIKRITSSGATNKVALRASLAVLGSWIALAAVTAQAAPYSPLTPQQLDCVSRFSQNVELKKAKGVPEKHLPRLYIPTRNVRDTVVIFTHGIFESPYFFKGINKVFQDQGYISISILLPGHWQGDWSSMETVSYRDWVEELDNNVAMAQCFGKKIIFAGHSLGGLLSIQAAVRYPQLTEALMVWSPALAVRTLPSIGGAIGGFLHLDGNLVMGKANLDEVPLYAPNAATQVKGLIKAITQKIGGGSLDGLYKKITMPTFFAYAEKDPAVDTSVLAKALKGIPGIKAQMYFPENTYVHHGNIVKFPEDAYKSKRWDYNTKMPAMQELVIDFLRTFVR